MSFIQLFPTNMLSLEFVLGFCHGIAKRGDCKVEFIQSFCWLYSIPNFLVFQHLKTLYLGGNHVRVRVCTQARPHDWILRPACGLQAAKGGTRVKHAKELKSHVSWSTTRQNFQSGQAVSSRLRLTTQSSREVKLPDHFV